MKDIHTATIIQSYIDAKPDKEYDSWRASSIGQCLRSHYFKRLGIEPTIPLTDITLRKFEAGNIFHDFIQGITEKEVDKLGGVVSNEVEMLDNELDLGGRYDMLIELDDKRILKDIKSQHSGMFHKLQREAKELTKEDTSEGRQRGMKEAFWEKYPHQVMQLAAYMVLLKRAGQPVDEGVIVRVSKDDLSLAEVHFELTDELEKRVLDEVALLNKHWKEKTLPYCTCSESDWGVKYCSYGDPKSLKAVEKTSGTTGKKYKSKPEITKCCSESLWKKEN